MTDCAAFGGFIAIPHMSPDGIQAANPSTPAFIDRVCGADFGLTGGVAGPLVCKFEFANIKNLGLILLAAQLPFVMGVFTAAAAQTGAEGFNMEYSQVKTNNNEIFI